MAKNPHHFLQPDFQRIYVMDDVLASLRTVLPKGAGGILLISGTGSNCLYHQETKEGTPVVHQCGGGGPFLGDQGSAWHIAINSIMKVFLVLEGRRDVDDGQWRSPDDVSAVQAAVFRHFGLGTTTPSQSRQDSESDVTNCRKSDLYPLLYGSNALSKKEIACFTETLSTMATAGNAFCQRQFYLAGKILAEHVAAVVLAAATDERSRSDFLKKN